MCYKKSADHEPFCSKSNVRTALIFIPLPQNENSFSHWQQAVCHSTISFDRSLDLIRRRANRMHTGDHRVLAHLVNPLAVGINHTWLGKPGFPLKPLLIS